MREGAGEAAGGTSVGDEAGGAAGVGGPVTLDGHRPAWPLSAICAVLVASVLVVVLVLVNLFGIRLTDGHYDPEVGGSMAEWFEAFATLLAIPAAVVFGVRQLQSTGAVLELERRQLVAEEAERTERRRAEQAILQRAVSLRVAVANVLDAPDLATDGERAAVERLVVEYRQRGWARDAAAGTWRQGTTVRSNAEQLAAEPTPLAPAPWFVAIECHNAGAVAVVVESWTVVDDTGSTTVDAPIELPPGHGHHHRLGSDEGLGDAYAHPDEATAAYRARTVVLEGFDAAGRPFRIVHQNRQNHQNRR